MEKIGIKGTMVFGAANIVVGLILAFFAIPFFVIWHFIWSPSTGQITFYLPPFLNYLQRSVCLVWYLSFLALFISGLKVLRRIPNSTKDALGAGILMLTSSLINFLIDLANEIFRFHVSLREISRGLPNVSFAFEEYWFYYASWIYAILIIFYFSRPEIIAQLKSKPA